MNKKLIEYFKTFSKEKKIDKQELKFFYENLNVYEKLEMCVDETTVEDFLDSCRENIKKISNSSSKFRKYDITLQFYNYLSKKVEGLDIKIEEEFGLLFSTVQERYIYLLKALQNKDLKLSVEQLGLNNLLYGHDVIREDINKLKNEGFNFCEQNGKLLNDTLHDNCHPIYLTLNSNELFVLMKALSEYGNLDGFAGRIMTRIYDQLSDNAKDFIEDRFEERDLDARYLSNDLSFKEIDEFKKESIYAIEICDKIKKKRIVVEFNNGNKVSGQVTYYSQDIFEVNGKEYYIDDVKNAYVQEEVRS